MNTSSDTDHFPSPRRGSTAQTRASEYRRRGRPVEQPSGAEGVESPKRGAPIAEPAAPPWRPHPDNDDLPSRRLDSLQPDTPSHDLLGRPLRPVAQASKADAEPEPEAPWDFEENKHRLRAMLTTEYPRWGWEHRKDFVDTIVQTVEQLIPAETASDADAKATNQAQDLPPV